MKILVSGASGLVGSALVRSLGRDGNDLRRLVRGPAQKGEIRWDVATGAIDQAALQEWQGPDAFVHLAGENLAGRWTSKKKQRIRASRVEATERLAQSLAKSGAVRTFVGASAIGYYGDRDDETLTEQSSKGAGFLADVSEAWEQAAQPIVKTGARVVHLRFGMVLSRDGGALAKMLPLFRAGLGGRLGTGRQWMSWISLTDVVRVIEFALREVDARGVFNGVAPNPVRNQDFANELGRQLGRPAVLPAPKAALRLVFGEMSDAVLLGSQRVLPERLQANGFRFQHPTLKDALQACLNDDSAKRQ